MGNRAVIALGGKDPSDVGIYLHWNGGPDSVDAFLQAAKQLGIRGPKSDPAYYAARMAQMIGNWFGGTLSVGVGPLSKLDCDNGDNGMYVIDDSFAVVERTHHRYHHSREGYQIAEMVAEIIAANSAFAKK